MDSAYIKRSSTMSEETLKMPPSSMPGSSPRLPDWTFEFGSDHQCSSYEVLIKLLSKMAYYYMIAKQT